MAVERSYVMIKPDGVQRGLMGEIVGRFERKGLKLCAMKLERVTEKQAEIHYGFLSDKPFYGELISFITSNPVLKMVWSGENAIAHIRNVVGATNPLESTPGTIRADYAVTTGNNIIHASDAVESAEKEISNFFTAQEVVEYKLINEAWLG